MKIKKSLITIICVMSMILMACGEKGSIIKNEGAESSQTGNVLELYTTIFPLEDFANKIGREYVHVTNLVPVGADAHTYEPTPREMIKVAEGDMFIYSGAGLEGFADALIETIKEENVAIVQASANIELTDFEDGHDDYEAENHDDEGHDHNEAENPGHNEVEGDALHDHHHDKDPHVWLDPLLAISLAESIKDALIDLMPEQEETFIANFEQLKSELEDIHAEFQEMVDQAGNNIFLVSHAGYGYWEERYGLKQMAIAGVSPTNEPSQRQLQRIIEFTNENGLKYILLEQNISTKIADVVKNATGVETLYLHNLESLTEKNAGEDYYSLMRKNIEALKIALQ
ncbi:zinc ABC transporter solute-binding protein [bacterium LRH843]|nr:zinc ABC transporter solute-binding protein [bacterium LRH843]